MFKDTIKALRKERGLTQTELAKVVGFTHVAVVKWENGQREPDFSTLTKLADYFGVTTDYLLGRDFVLPSFQIFERICTMAGKTIFEVANEVGLTCDQLTQWENGIEPSKRILWAIANACQCHSNPFEKVKEKKSIIERPTSATPTASLPAVFEEMPDLLSEERFVNTAKIYHELPDEMRERAYMLVYGIAVGIGLNVENILRR